MSAEDRPDPASVVQHELRAWPSYFAPVWSGDKSFEVRFDDRGFQRGDLVWIREWDRDRRCGCDLPHHDPTNCARYTGREVTARIGYVLASLPPRGPRKGFSGDGYVVFALCDLERTQVLQADGSSGVARTEGAPAPSPATIFAEALRRTGGLS